MALSEHALSADLLVTNTTKSEPNDATTVVYVVSLERHDDTMCRVALYKVSLCNSEHTVSLNLLSRKRYESICSNITSDSATIQLWNNTTKQESVGFSMTVLEQQGGAHTATAFSNSVTSEQLPVLTMYTAQLVNEDKWIIKSPTIHNCIPVANSSLASQENSPSTQSPTMLLSLLTSDSLTSNMRMHGCAITVQLRTYTSTIANIPLYINQDSTLDSGIILLSTNDRPDVYTHCKDTVNVLELFALLFNALDQQPTSETTKPDTLKDKISTWLREVCDRVCNNVAQGRERELFELIDTVYAHYKCSPLADALLNKLRQYLTIVCGTSSSDTDSIRSYFDPSVSPYAQRALQLLVLVHNTNTTVADTCSNTVNTSASTDNATSNATSFKLSGSVVANLLFSEQDKLLALLVPRSSGTNNTDTTSSITDGSFVNAVHALLRGDNNNPSSPTKANTESFTNNNSYIKFTATTDTSVSSISTIDILSYLTSIHAALWMHDVTPLLDVIYKHAMTSFRKHKSSIQVHILHNNTFCCSVFTSFSPRPCLLPCFNGLYFVLILHIGIPGDGVGGQRRDPSPAGKNRPRKVWQTIVVLVNPARQLQQ